MNKNYYERFKLRVFWIGIGAYGAWGLMLWFASRVIPMAQRALIGSAYPPILMPETGISADKVLHYEDGLKIPILPIQNPSSGRVLVSLTKSLIFYVFFKKTNLIGVFVRRFHFIHTRQS